MNAADIFCLGIVRISCDDCLIMGSTNTRYDHEAGCMVTRFASTSMDVCHAPMMYQYQPLPLWDSGNAEHHFWLGAYRNLQREFPFRDVLMVGYCG